MSGAKIRLSVKELELVANTELILTKNAILEKAKLLLQEVSLSLEEYIQLNVGLFPPEALLVKPKISRGENYKGLPYLILDYPRCFEKEHILAIRTMFWWGNYFSVTLHLSGRYKNLYQQKIIAAFNNLANDNTYLCIHTNQWEHHFEKDNFALIRTFSIKEFGKTIQQQEFIKLAIKTPLEKWGEAIEILMANCKKMIAVLRG